MKFKENNSYSFHHSNIPKIKIIDKIKLIKGTTDIFKVFFLSIYYFLDFKVL